MRCISQRASVEHWKAWTGLVEMQGGARPARGVDDFVKRDFA